MIQNGAGGGGSVFHVAVVEGTDKHLVDGGDYNLKKCLFGLVLLVKYSGGDVMGVSQVGYLGAGRDQWDGGLGTGVDGSDGGRGQECFIHSRGDGEVKYVKCAASKV